MAIFRKDCLHPGTYRLPSGRVVKYTPEDTAHLAKRMGEMITSGFHVPVIWEHDDDSTPLSEKAKQEALGTIGFVDRSFLESGKITGAEFSADDPDDVKKLKKVRYVSPFIKNNWTDANGRFWPGLSIMHLAATPRPVQYNQRPFEQVALSSAAYFETDDVDSIRMGEAIMADEKKKPDDDETPPEKKPAVPEEVAKVPEETPAAPALEPEAPVMPEMPASAGPLNPDLLPALAAMAIILPADTNAENLQERLLTAIATQQATEAKAKAEASPEQQPSNDGLNFQAGQDAGKGLEPSSQTPSVAMSEAERRIDRVETRQKERDRYDLKKRIKAVFESGKCDRPTAVARTSEIDAVRLSYDDTGDVQAEGDLLVWLKVVESLPDGAVWEPASGKPWHAGTRLSASDELGDGEFPNGNGYSPERDESDINDGLKLLGLRR